MNLDDLSALAKSLPRVPKYSLRVGDFERFVGWLGCPVVVGASTFSSIPVTLDGALPADTAQLLDGERVVRTFKYGS